MKVVAVLEVVSSDDGMVWVKTGLVANHKEQIAIIDERLCFSLNDKFKNGMKKNWKDFMESPEYVPYKLLT